VSEHDLQDLSGRDKDHGAEAVAGLQRKVRGLQLRQVAGLEFATLQDRPSSWAAVNCYGDTLPFRETAGPQDEACVAG
jgi:hypothetical protein